MIRCWQETLCAATLGIALLLVAMPEADAQSTRLTLDSPPRLVVGQYATFTGSLVTASGSPVGGAEIDIKDDDPGFDDYIATVRTGSDGRFAAKVLVKNWDKWSSTVEIYAVYEGGTHSKSRSSTWEVRVADASGSGGSSGGSYSGGSSSGSSAPAKSPTQIELYATSSSVYVGDTITFSGYLTSGNRPLSGATIHIKEDVSFGRDKILKTATTDRNGRYSATWNAKALTFSGDATLFAVFEGSENYLRKATPKYKFSILKYAGSITLDPFPRSAHIGDPVTFSGRLYLEGTDTTNVIVYIMDEDFLNPDDLLATAYVDSDGSYAVTWTARKVDYDSRADIYAVFEGGSTHYRYTTCDPGPTPQSGGSCNGTRELRTFAARPYVPPKPSGIEYMDLNHVIGFTDRPTVAIVPNPKAYDTVRSYIAPSQEGLLKLSSELAARHGGDWNLRYEVIEPGKWRANSRADVVLNIITGDQDARCDSNTLGWAPANPTALPIQINVCAASRSDLHPKSTATLVATHEFIHALGVGHTFNKSGDLMCSVENGKQTCPNSYAEEPRPSALNLEAIAALYGRDGYMVPNNPRNFNIPGYFTLENARTISPTSQTVNTYPRPSTGGTSNDAVFDFEIAPTRKFSEYADYVRSLDYFGSAIQYLNRSFTLPHDINVRLAECGSSRHPYNSVSHTVRLCYEDVVDYVNETYDLEYSETETHAYVARNLAFSLYYGLGRALIDIHDLPLSDYKVHAADSFAAYIMLTSFADVNVGQEAMYDASTHLYRQSESDEETEASRAHALDRFNRLTCYAYGQDTEANAHLVAEGWIDESSGSFCSTTYTTLVGLWDAAPIGYIGS